MTHRQSLRPIRSWPAALFLLLTLAGLSAAQNAASIPAGTKIEVRVIENLSSANSNAGDPFTGTLTSAIVANGRTMFPKGADVTGEVIAVERSGRLSNPGELHLELRTIRSKGRTYTVYAEPFSIKGESHAKSNVGKIGGGAAIGAIVGAITGGGKGAAIGAGVGAAVGTGVAAATGKKEASVESEAVLTWLAAAPPESSRPGGIVRASRNFREGDARSIRSYDNDDRLLTEFSPRDRRVILGCFGDARPGPPGLAKRNRLPPGLDKQVRRNGTLPPGLQKKVQGLPAGCEARLPRLPQQWARVILSGRILLLDPSRRIVDLFWLDIDAY